MLAADSAPDCTGKQVLLAEAGQDKPPFSGLLRTYPGLYQDFTRALL